MDCTYRYVQAAALAFLLTFATSGRHVFADPVVEVRQTADYLALSFEAEDYSTADERWVLTDPTTPALDASADPDPNHSDLAVGNAYLELLPDYRVTEHDPFVGPNGERGLWNTPGTGPELSYDIDFPQAGRYYVHARALSTGKEDNGMHIGLNGQWPDSGVRHQFCTAGQGWKWSSRQRDSGGEGNPCGVDFTIWLTVPTPGMHTVNISAREDGFELDRLMLIKDLSDNTRVCFAHSENSIACRDDSLENTDDIADLSVQISSSVGVMNIDDTVTVSVDVANLDSFDAASDVVLNIDLALGTGWTLNSTEPADCTVQNSALSCNFGLLEVGDSRSLQFDLNPLVSGELPLQASITSSTVDIDQTNNASSVSVSVSETVRLSRLEAQLTSAGDAWTSGETGSVTARVQNLGPGIADSASLEFMLADGLLVSTLPEGCLGNSIIICDLGDLDVGAFESRTLMVSADEAGLYSISAMASAVNMDGETPLQTYIATIFGERGIEEPVRTAYASEQAANLPGGSGAVGPALLWLLFGSICVSVYRFRR